MNPFKFLNISLILVTICDSYRILAVFPMPSISDQRTFSHFTSILCNHGHEVVVITPNAKEYNQSENVSVIDVIEETKQSLIKYNKEDFVNNEEILKKMELTPVEANEMFKSQYESRKLQDIIKNNEKFDLLLLDAHFPPSLVITQAFDIPVIMINCKPDTQRELDKLFGIDKHLLIDSNHEIQNSMWKIISNVAAKPLYGTHKDHSKSIMEDLFGKNTPPFKALYGKVELVLHYKNTVWESNKAMPAGLVNVKSIDRKYNVNVTENITNYLDSSENGVILSNFEYESLNKIQHTVFLEIVSKMPYDFLLKWPSDNLPNKPKNVNLYTFIPQVDVLKHPSVKAMITQGDSNSISDSLEAGVPIIVIPITSEEITNADQIVLHDVGLKVDIHLQKELLEDAIRTIMNNNRYQNNAIKMGKILSDHPQSDEERAVWWIEYAVRHQGTSHFRSPTANISWSTYLVLDVLGIVFGTALVILVVIGLILKLLLSNFRFHKRKMSNHEDFWTILPTHSRKVRF